MGKDSRRREEVTAPGDRKFTLVKLFIISAPEVIAWCLTQFIDSNAHLFWKHLTDKPSRNALPATQTSFALVRLTPKINHDILALLNNSVNRFSALSSFCVRFPSGLHEHCSCSRCTKTSGIL
jgi:hypothetical protein